MADSTLDSEKFVLFDKWPGVPDKVESDNIPSGSMTAATHHNVASAAYRPGEKIQVWNDGAVAGVAGWSVFIYLKFLAVTAANPTPAAKQLVVPSLSGTPYQVTNDPDQCLVATGSALAAVLLSAMSFDNSNAYYGWAWCGGVCPEAHVSALGGNYATEGNVAAGPIVAHNLTADAIGLGPCGGATEAIIGWAYEADA